MYTLQTSLENSMQIKQYADSPKNFFKLSFSCLKSYKIHTEYRHLSLKSSLVKNHVLSKTTQTTNEEQNVVETYYEIRK